MAFSRRFGVVGILAGLWLVAVGCDDSSDRKVTNPSDGGEGGEALNGGKSAGGSSNNAGKGGATTAGKGGSGGATAGMGISGDAGAGQAGGGTEVVAGAGGAGGAGGAPAATAFACAYSCGVDNDCSVNGDATQKCNLTNHHCEDPANTCTVDSDCLAAITPFFGSCVADVDCFLPDRCVKLHGFGYCGTPPDVETGCDIPNVVFKLKLFETGVDVDICGSPNARCASGTCIAGCSVDACPTGTGDTCNETTGLCECATGAKCKSGVCGADGHCQECVTSNDCAPKSASTGLDTCVNGRCGCSVATSCPASHFDNAPAVCQ